MKEGTAVPPLIWGTADADGLQYNAAAWRVRMDKQELRRACRAGKAATGRNHIQIEMEGHDSWGGEACCHPKMHA